MARFLRIRVEVPLDKPIRKGAPVRSSEGDEVWVAFQYERLLGWCYNCGMLGHEARACSVSPVVMEERPYGEWLRHDEASNGNPANIASGTRIMDHQVANFTGLEGSEEPKDSTPFQNGISTHFQTATDQDNPDIWMHTDRGMEYYPENIGDNFISVPITYEDICGEEVLAHSEEILATTSGALQSRSSSCENNKQPQTSLRKWKKIKRKGKKQAPGRKIDTNHDEVAVG
uniref:CCHC-type domain-containing protein n=1 Tax=Quercus lobata TaxID=97700 RepID=A0A7N2L853_QUELO